MGASTIGAEPANSLEGFSRRVTAYALTVVAPTYNEAGNVAVLVERLRTVLQGVDWQVIFVDDNSPDGTWEAVKALAAEDRRVECLRRVGRRGLAGAVIEGVLASAAPVVAVMDADLQHDAGLIPAMFEAVQSGRVDLAIASRYVDTASAGAGLSAFRALGSRWANGLARLVLKTKLSDPMSGYFVIRRELVERVAPRLSTQGFKILLDIVASHPEPLRVSEFAYRFADRQYGASKLNHQVVLDYLGLLTAKATRNVIPARAILFAMVGASGLLVQLLAMRTGLFLGLTFDRALVIAGLMALTSNYLINNWVTYSDRRRSGVALITGYFKFCSLCGIPLLVNLAVAHLVYQHAPSWWLAGAAGALVGAVWNYVSTAVAVW